MDAKPPQKSPGTLNLFGKAGMEAMFSFYMNLEKAVVGFVGANLFARTTGYVRINSHLQKRHNPLKCLNVLR
jgi:hypothetical protein